MSFFLFFNWIYVIWLFEKKDDNKYNNWNKKNELAPIFEYFDSGVVQISDLWYAEGKDESKYRR